MTEVHTRNSGGICEEGANGLISRLLEAILHSRWDEYKTLSLCFMEKSSLKLHSHFPHAL